MKYLLCIMSMLLAVSLSKGQQAATPTTGDIASIVKSRKYEFVAESANPMRGRTIFLSPGYSFVVRPDSLLSHLPYYGRAYQATFDPSSAGIKFTSTDFEYTEKPRKKGGWDIQIRPKDVQQSQLYLSIHDNGRASLRVISIDRQTISFQGFIRQVTN